MVLRAGALMPPTIHAPGRPGASRSSHSGQKLTDSRGWSWGEPLLTGVYDWCPACFQRAAMSESAISGLGLRGPGPTAASTPAVERGTTAPAAAAPAAAAPAAAAPVRAVDAAARRRRRGLRQEFAARIGVVTVVLVFNEIFTLGHETSSVIRLTALIGLGLNALYLAAIRAGRGLRVQAYLRTLVDVGLITAGLYGAGGLGAAQYIGIHAIVPVYAAIVFSSVACALAVVF